MKFNYLGKYKPKEQEIKIVRFLIDNKIYRQDIETQKKMLDYALTELCKIYNIEKPNLIVEINKEMYYSTGGGSYCVKTKKIHLYKISIVTFLHEFAHALQYQQKGYSDEEFPRAYSVNIFAVASPNLFWKAVENKKIFFV